MHKNPARLQLSVACGLAVLALSCSAILIRWTDAPAVTIAFYRLAGSAAVLLSASGGSTQSRPRFRDVWGMALSGVFLAGHFGLWIASLRYSSVAVSVLLVSLHPLLVGAAGPVMGDRLPSGFFLSLLLVLPGLVLTVLGRADGSGAVATSGIGIALSLGGMVMMAGYLLSGRRLRQRLPNRVYAGGTYAAGAVVLFGVAVAAGTPLFGFSAGDYVLFALLALIPTLLGHTVLNWALGYVSAAGVSVLYLGEPVGAAVLAAVLLGELPGAGVIAGGTLVLGGLYIVSRSIEPVIRQVET